MTEHAGVTQPAIDRAERLVLIRSADGDAWEDKTADIAWVDVGRTGVGVRFHRSPKTYHYRAERVRLLTESAVVPLSEGARLRVGGVVWRAGDMSNVTLREFGHPPDSWRVISYRAGAAVQHESHRADEVQVVSDASRHGRAREIMDYWRRIVDNLAGGENDLGRQPPIVQAYRSLRFVDEGSVLAAYLNGEPPARVQPPEALVFPFGCNLSQREAVQQGLTHTLSIIEGPPGTGKTETILNLIANIVTFDLGAVGVVSFSNSAVDNVREKLEARGFGDMVADLGNSEKRRAFEASHATRAARVRALLGGEQPHAPSSSELLNADRRTMQALREERQRAELRNRIDAYVLEHTHFTRQAEAGTTRVLDGLPLLRRPAERILEFIAETQLDQEAGPPRMLARVRRYLRYGATRGLDTANADVVVALQAAFYRRRLAELKRAYAQIERSLAVADAAQRADERRELSERALTAALWLRYREREQSRGSGSLPRDEPGFKRFCRQYPVVLSTCHSLRQNVPDGYLLDYLIIDEASQVDLLTASLAMASCRHLIVVGDRHQLPHIPGSVNRDLTAPIMAYDYPTRSLIASVDEVYDATLPVTLLREHYRSHPAIIGFCNAAFYQGQLIPYTESGGRREPAMWIHPTVPGNHARSHGGGGWSNQREVDVIRQEVLGQAPPGIDRTGVAVATPYRRQVELGQGSLRDVVGVIDTVHKLQGREWQMVILTTVLSDRSGRRALGFVDDPRLINVAVSRATDHFVLVTDHRQLPESRHVRDLIGYIEHHYPDSQPGSSRVVSVFDLLYREYDEILQSLARRVQTERGSGFGSPAERILAPVIADILAEPGYRHLSVHREVLLRTLVSAGEPLGEEQRTFVHRRSSIDFLISNRVTHRAVLAIEVDGHAYHVDNPAQERRDRLKDTILARAGVPLLRLRTTGSGEPQRIREALEKPTGPPHEAPGK